jgi:predicted TIM-barrel fold metal-dependent hydrolase
MIIDIHTHLFANGWIPRSFFHGVARFVTHELAKQGIEESNEEMGDALLDGSSDPNAEMLIEEMDDAGIDVSVVFPMDFGLELGEPEVPIEEVNRILSELGKKHPSRLIPFATVDPRRDGAVALIEKCVEKWDMKGLKLHPSAGFYANSKEVYSLLERANAWKIPVIIHSSNMMLPLKSKYSQPLLFDDLATDFPDLPIICAHAGGHFGYRQMISIMSMKLNLLVDISAWQILADKSYPRFCRSLRELIDFTEPERVFFGSDSPSFRSIMANEDWVKLIKELPRKAPEGISFTEDEIDKIMGRNAKRLLNL